jgi:hypothetical protein
MHLNVAEAADVAVRRDRFGRERVSVTYNIMFIRRTAHERTRRQSVPSTIVSQDAATFELAPSDSGLADFKVVSSAKGFLWRFDIHLNFAARRGFVISETMAAGSSPIVVTLSAHLVGVFR